MSPSACNGHDQRLTDNGADTISGCALSRHAQGWFSGGCLGGMTDGLPRARDGNNRHWDWVLEGALSLNGCGWPLALLHMLIPFQVFLLYRSL